MSSRVTLTLRVEVMPWVHPFLAIMDRLCRGPASVNAVAEFVRDHGIRATP